MKKLKFMLPIITFLIIIFIGFIQVNISNTTFYNYNKEKINSEEFQSLIQEFDGGLKKQFTDKSEVKIYYDENNNLVADLGNYEMMLKDNDGSWIENMVERVKKTFNELLSKITRSVEN